MMIASIANLMIKIKIIMSEQSVEREPRRNEDWLVGLSSVGL